MVGCHGASVGSGTAFVFGNLFGVFFVSGGVFAEKDLASALVDAAGVGWIVWV